MFDSVGFGFVGRVFLFCVEEIEILVWAIVDGVFYGRRIYMEEGIFLGAFLKKLNGSSLFCVLLPVTANLLVMIGFALVIP